VSGVGMIVAPDFTMSGLACPPRLRPVHNDHTTTSTPIRSTLRSLSVQIDSEYQPPKQPKAMPDSQKKITILLVASCTSIAAIVLLWLLQRCTIQLHTEEAASSESTAGVLGKVLTFECRV